MCATNRERHRAVAQDRNEQVVYLYLVRTSAALFTVFGFSSFYSVSAGEPMGSAFEKPTIVSFEMFTAIHERLYSCMTSLLGKESLNQLVNSLYVGALPAWKPSGSGSCCCLAAGRVALHEARRTSGLGGPRADAAPSSGTD
jgi:hypothetical protein